MPDTVGVRLSGVCATRLRPGGGSPPARTCVQAPNTKNRCHQCASHASRKLRWLIKLKPDVSTDVSKEPSQSMTELPDLSADAFLFHFVMMERVGLTGMVFVDTMKDVELPRRTTMVADRPYSDVVMPQGES